MCQYMILYMKSVKRIDFRLLFGNALNALEKMIVKLQSDLKVFSVLARCEKEGAPFYFLYLASTKIMKHFYNVCLRESLWLFEHPVHINHTVRNNAHRERFRRSSTGDINLIDLTWTYIFEIALIGRTVSNMFLFFISKMKRIIYMQYSRF